MEQEVLTFGKKAQNAKKMIDILYRQPLVTINDIVNELGVSKPTINSLVKDFENKGILKEITGHKRNKIYVFDEYLKIYSKS